MGKVKLRIRWGKHNPGDIIPLGPQLYDLAIRKGWATPYEDVTMTGEKVIDGKDAGHKVIEPEYKKKVIEPKSKKK
jgi:hypothetical protein